MFIDWVEEASGIRMDGVDWLSLGGAWLGSPSPWISCLSWEDYCCCLTCAGVNFFFIFSTNAKSNTKISLFLFINCCSHNIFFHIFPFVLLASILSLYIFFNITRNLSKPPFFFSFSLFTYLMFSFYSFFRFSFCYPCWLQFLFSSIFFNTIAISDTKPSSSGLVLYISCFLSFLSLNFHYRIHSFIYVCTCLIVVCVLQLKKMGYRFSVAGHRKLDLWL